MSTSTSWIASVGDARLTVKDEAEKRVDGEGDLIEKCDPSKDRTWKMDIMETQSWSSQPNEIGTKTNEVQMAGQMAAMKLQLVSEMENDEIWSIGHYGGG